MPANKNAYIRYKALDECFRDWGKQYTWEKLQDYEVAPAFVANN